jgi:hypothetical protein
MSYKVEEPYGMSRWHMVLREMGEKWGMHRVIF